MHVIRLLSIRTSSSTETICTHFVYIVLHDFAFCNIIMFYIRVESLPLSLLCPWCHRATFYAKSPGDGSLSAWNSHNLDRGLVILMQLIVETDDIPSHFVIKRVLVCLDGSQLPRQGTDMVIPRNPLLVHKHLGANIHL